MFVKHIIKTATFFGHNCLTIFRGSSFVLSAVTTSLLVCVFYLVRGCNVVYVCVCLMYLSVGCLVVNCSQPNIPQTSTSGTHTDRQRTATYEINDLTTQTSIEGSNSTK